MAEQVEARLANLEARVNNIEKGAAVDEVHRLNVEKRLGSIEDTLKWMVRLLLGVIIAAIMTFIINGGLHVG